MANQFVPALLKANLGFYDSALPEGLDAELNSLIATAEERLQGVCGIRLDPNSQSDAQLISSFAAWLYRSKVTGAGKPQALKDDIKDRQVHQALKTEETP